MQRIKSFVLLLAAALLAGCNGFECPFTGTYDQVLIYYGMGFNNLSANLETNLDQLRTDVLPGLSDNRAIAVFCHTTAGGYRTPNPPVLMRFYRGSDGKPVTDTLKVYENMDLSASRESIRQVLQDVKERFPSRRYGMLVSSHGTGWLPPAYNYNSETSRASRRKALAQPATPWPATKAIGNQYVGSATNVTWVPLQDFAEAFPLHLDYLILDTCLSGAVEVAYELKDVCDRFVISPAEILTAGMVYSTLSWDMFAAGDPDLRTYCEEYFKYYDSQSGNHRAGTIALVESAGLDALAGAFGAIVDAHRAALQQPSVRESTQRYFYNSSPLRFFYDLRDFCVQLGATSAELDRLDAALAAAVPYHAETPMFFDLPLEHCCGLSVYIPEAGRPQLNDYYKTLAWNRAVGLVE